MTFTIPQMLRYRAATHPSRIAYVYNNEEVSYETYYQQATGAAAYLLSLGIQRGERIAILDFNNAQVVNLISGAMIAGIIPVSINWRATPDEVRYIMKDTEAKHLFFGPAFAPLVKYASLSGEVSLVEVQTIHTLISGFDSYTADTAILPEDLCTILYTSGTTGKPKGVLLTHKNIYTCYDISMAETPSSGPDARVLICGPLFSIFGFGIFFATIHAGATAFFLQMFDPTGVCAALQQYKITHTLLIPIMMRMMLGVPGIDTMDFSSLKHVQYGGSPIAPDVLQKINQLFQCDFTQAYGLTETSGISSYLRFDDHRRLLQSGDVSTHPIMKSAGKPAAGILLKTVKDDGTEASVNEPGEVWLKGDNVAMGYWNKAEETARVFTPDGWFITGDVGYLDNDGYLYLVDRKNDMIVSKGFNIYPAEVETILLQHPAVKEIAVIGIPDEVAGEAVCAVVVPRTEDELSLEELRTWSEGKISRNKIPKHLHIAKELPRNQTGKVLRRILREPFWVAEERNIKG